MRVTRVFCGEPLRPGGEVVLGKEAARHLVTVLRLRPGDPVALFDGRGGEHRGEILEAGAKAVRVGLADWHPDDRESPLRTLLGVGISRGERFDWVLQKATELGVSDLFPLYTERTEVKLKGDREEKKQRHWHQVVVSACEQCGRNRLPAVHPPQPVHEWLSVATDIKLVLHHRATATLRSLAAHRPASVALLIGPKGGLSGHEIEQAQAMGFQGLTLGPRVLRTETAPLAALSLLQALWGDF